MKYRIYSGFILSALVMYIIYYMHVIENKPRLSKLNTKGKTETGTQQKDELQEHSVDFTTPGDYDERITTNQDRQSTKDSDTAEPVKPDIDNNMAPDEVYKKRLEQLQDGCKLYNSSMSKNFNKDTIQYHSMCDSKSSVVFCPIPKVGSTFWRRIFGIMGTSENYSSPFQIRRGTLKVTRLSNLRDILSAHKFNAFLQNAMSFVFVREPYSKLFSGYENKLYNANPMFWTSYGKAIAKIIRNNASEISLKYGHDISFVEFIKYILYQHRNGRSINAHFKPMNTLCDPCSMPFHIVGKLETFKQDAEHLFSLMKEKNNQFKISINAFEKETAMDATASIVNILYGMKPHIRALFDDYPFHNLLIRVWSGLQIRGYLSKNISLPFSPSESKDLSKESLMKAFQTALNTPVDQTALKRQRQEAMVQAYRTIPLSDMEKLREFVLKDCKLFGYEDRPVKLFDRGKESPVAVYEHTYMNGL